MAPIESTSRANGPALLSPSKKPIERTRSGSAGEAFRIVRPNEVSWDSLSGTLTSIHLPFTVLNSSRYENAVRFVGTYRFSERANNDGVIGRFLVTAYSEGETRTGWLLRMRGDQKYESRGSARLRRGSRLRTVVINCAACMVLLWGCNSNPSNVVPDMEWDTTVNVEVLRAQAVKNVLAKRQRFGTVKPRMVSVLSFARGGKVAEIYFEIGDDVKEGDELATLELRGLSRQRELIQESMEADRAALANLQRNASGPGQAQRLNQLRQRLTSQASQLEDIETKLATGTILAPFDGRISQRFVDSGASLGAGRPAIRLVSTKSPRIEMKLPAMGAQELTVGQSVTVQRREAKYEARVATKSPELNPASRTQQIFLELLDEDDDGDWLFGETVRIHYRARTDLEGVWLPYSSLKRAPNGLWSAYVVVNSNGQQKIHRRTLTVDRLEGERVLVGGALVNGDLVLVSGLNRVVPGQTVQVKTIRDAQADSSHDDEVLNEDIKNLDSVSIGETE